MLSISFKRASIHSHIDFRPRSLRLCSIRIIRQQIGSSIYSSIEMNSQNGNRWGTEAEEWRRIFIIFI